MNLKLRHCLSAIDAKFMLGVAGLGLALVGAVETGRAFSAAQSLSSALDQASSAALATLAEANDPVAVSAAAVASFKETEAGALSAVLATVSLDQARGALVLEASIPVEMKVLSPLGLGKLQIARRLETRIK